MPPMARLISLGILTALIVLLGVTFYQVVAPFLLPLFLAGVTAILCRPLYLWAIRRTNGRERLGAALTTVAVLVAVLLPIVAGTAFGAAELIQLGRTTIGSEAWRQRVLTVKSRPWVLDLAERAEAVLSHTEGVDPLAETNRLVGNGSRTAGAGLAAGPPAVAEIVTPGVTTEQSEPLSDEARADRLRERIDTSLRAALVYVGGRTVGVFGSVPGVALGVIGKAAGLLVSVAIFTIALYYFLCDGPALLKAAEGLVPVRKDYQRQLLERFDTVVRAVVLSTFLAALAQGVLTTGALALCGFDHLIVLFVLCSLGAMIPMLGTWPVWGPAAVWLAMHDRVGAAVMLAAFGVGVVGTIDNVIRTYVLNNDAKLHPLLAFVSVLGGLRVMGLWGVFIGPIVAACLHALVQIFNTELKAFSQERVGGEPATVPLPPASAPPPRPQVTLPKWARRKGRK